MLRGNQLRGFLVWAMAATMNVAVVAQTAERATSVPLGGISALQTGDRDFAVYIPTRFGGELTVKTSSGQVEGLKTSKGLVLKNGQDIGLDQEGWATFKVSGAKKSYTVETIFVQLGQSTKRPWNFYYWPTKADSIHEPWAGGNGRVDTMDVKGDDELVASPGSYIAPGVDIVLAGPNGLLETMPAPGDDATWFPNLYDDLTWVGPNKEKGNETTIFLTQSPMLKYDQIFRSGARQWEGAFSQSNGISRWPGHCLGGAVASIILNEPTPAPGSGLTRDELKGLWAELGENHLNHRIGDYATDIPPGPPRPGPDVTDNKVARVHAMLETHIRGEHRALLANLRAFPPRGMLNEVWNHGVYKYIAGYHSIPGRDPRAVRVVVELHANSGSMLNGQEDNDRVVFYEYSLVYGGDGRVDESDPNATDWIGVAGEAMFAPLNVMQVLDSRWAGHNPHVTEANVRTLDLANGGSAYGRLAGPPPKFRPVLEYEAGRPRLANNTSRTTETVRPPRTGGGGLFRGFFRGR